jgi:hypothetical protein
MRILLTLAAAGLLIAPQLAAAQAPCLTPGEFTALSSYALPSVIDGVSQRCAAQLPAEAFLRRDGAGLSKRYAAQKPGAWPGAKAAFLKLSSSGGDQAADLIRGMPDASLQPMLDAFVSGSISQKLPLGQCSTIDHVIRLLAPLPPENTAELIALAAGLGAKSGRAKAGDFSLCPA